MDIELTISGASDIAQELCDVCLGPCTYETERRCVACDRPVCPSCTASAPGRAGTWCPECGSRTRH